MSRIPFIAVAATLLVLTYFYFPPIATGGDLGVCLPSPNQWPLTHLGGWLINTGLILLTVIVMAASNKRFNYIPGAFPAMPLALLILLASNCISTSGLSTSTLLLFINAVSLYVIISTYEERNASREFFFIGTLPAIGAMFQYAFLIMVPVYIGGGLAMKSFKLREFIAFILGLITPYWIALGLGLVSPFAFRLPDTLVIFSQEAVESDIFLSMLSAGAMAFLGIILSLYNGVRLFSRNSRMRGLHLTFNLMGYVAVLATIFDFNNFMAYYGTLALWLAIETATLLHLYNIRNSYAALLLIMIIFFPMYFLAL